jgi:hypothetical protein
MIIHKREKDYLVRHQLIVEFEEEFDQEFFDGLDDEDHTIRIGSAFNWGRSKRGSDFWNRVHLNVIRGQH